MPGRVRWVGSWVGVRGAVGLLVVMLLLARGAKGGRGAKSREGGERDQAAGLVRHAPYLRSQFSPSPAVRLDI